MPFGGVFHPRGGRERLQIAGHEKTLVKPEFPINGARGVVVLLLNVLLICFCSNYIESLPGESCFYWDVTHKVRFPVDNICTCEWIYLLACSA